MAGCSSVSIVRALQERECGKGRGKVFRQLALELAEISLIERLKSEDLCKSLDDLSNETESVFNIEQSHNGHYAATVQTNKSVNIFEVTSMRKKAEYHTNERSVWTLSFHPTNSNIIAFGTLGGKVLVYVDGQETAVLSVIEPICSVCFHPVGNYLVFASGNGITFWDWQNDSTQIVDMFSDCKCRFLQITTDSVLVTAISQTLQFASAGIAKNLGSVEPQGMMVSFLRTVNFMLDALEHGCTIGNSFNCELKKQFFFWNHMINGILSKTDQLRYFSSINADAKCTKSYLDDTLRILDRRVDIILECVERMALNRMAPPANENICDNTIDKYCFEPMVYFERVCYNFVEQSCGYMKYSFDISLVRSIMRKLYRLFLEFGHTVTTEEWPNPEFYLDSSRAAQKNQFILQAWNVETFCGVTEFPNFKEDWRNVLTVCSINNDSNVSISQCERFISTVRIKAVKEMEVRSLSRDSFGECLFVFKFVANFVSLSFSPSGKYIVIGLRCKQRMKFAYVLDKDTKWKVGVDFRTVSDIVESNQQEAESCGPNERVGLKLCLPKESSNYKEINCIKWAALPGYGFFVGLKSKFIQICR